MANLRKYRNQFNVVLNLFTSFGYLPTDRANEGVLRQLISCLRPGGSLVLNLADKHWLDKIFSPNGWEETEMFFLLIKRGHLEKNYRSDELVVIDKKTGKTKRHRHKLRIYAKEEMVSLMKKCGLRKVRVFGNFNGNRYRRGKSSHPIYIGEKQQ